MQEDRIENGPEADMETNRVTAESHPQQTNAERVVEPENALPEVTLEDLPEVNMEIGERLLR
ncbi:MAG: hypothetical protein AAB112_02055, partial [Thermodesulfobacteriota bacterium]